MLSYYGVSGKSSQAGWVSGRRRLWFKGIVVVLSVMCFVNYVRLRERSWLFTDVAIEHQYVLCTLYIVQGKMVEATKVTMRE